MNDEEFARKNCCVLREQSGAILYTGFCTCNCLNFFNYKSDRINRKKLCITPKRGNCRRILSKLQLQLCASGGRVLRGRVGGVRGPAADGAGAAKRSAGASREMPGPGDPLPIIGTDYDGVRGGLARFDVNDGLGCLVVRETAQEIDFV